MSEKCYVLKWDIAVKLKAERDALRAQVAKLEVAGGALESFARTDCWEMWFVDPDGAEARGRELAQAWQEARGVVIPDVGKA